MAHAHLALARAISRMERGEDVDLGSANANSAQVIGISGPPGAGKSVLTGRLVQQAGQQGLKVAVLAVDPSSPMTGGAILADRLRIPAELTSERVFIRSLASRGALGGLSRICYAVARLLENQGFDRIIIETVGVGQNETDILNVADTVIIVQSPGSGDEIQAMKAGVLEIADIFVVNKVDMPDAFLTVCNIKDVAASLKRPNWQVPVVETSALQGDGIEQLWQTLEQHLAWLKASDTRQQRRIRGWQHYLRYRVMEQLLKGLPLTEYAEKVASGELAEAAAVAALIKRSSEAQT